jgi:hypothetical protein
MPTTPTQATVPTMASAALPPCLSSSTPIWLQISLSDATAPSFASFTTTGLEQPGVYACFVTGLPNAVCSVNRPVRAYRDNIAPGAMTALQRVEGKVQRPRKQCSHGGQLQLKCELGAGLVAVQPVIVRAMPITVASLCALGSSILGWHLSGSASRTRSPIVIATY